MKMKTKPYEHQEHYYRWSEGRDIAALYHYMRKGKTKSVIDDLNRARQEGRINAVLVIAPNGVHSNWARHEIPKHQWDGAPWKVWEWNTKDKTSTNRFLEVWKEKAFVWYCIPTHAIWRDDLTLILRRIVGKRKVGVVFDESHTFAKPGTKQTKRARWNSKQCIIRRALTGTPLENQPLQAWSQFELLEPGLLGFRTYEDFKKMYAVYERGQKAERDENGEVIKIRFFPKLIGYQNLDDLRNRIAPYCHCLLYTSPSPRD